MDYEIPESLRLMQETIRRFVNQDLEPLSQQVEDEDHIPEAIVQKMRELGLFGLSIPEEYGGLDLGTFGECLVYEELTKTNAAFRSRIGTSNGIGYMGILLDGTEEQKQKYLSEHAGRHGHRDLCRPADALPRRFAAGPGPDGDQRSLHGQTLLYGDGLPGGRSGRPDFRRHGLHEGFSRGTVLPRSPLIPDL